MSSIDPASLGLADAATMSERVAHPDYAARAVDAILRVQQATDPPQLLDDLMHATLVIGANASFYTTAIPEDGDEPSSFSLFACDPGFAHRQQRLGRLQEHPWFRFARTHAIPGTEQQIPLRHPTDIAAIDLAREYGFRSCLVVPTFAGVDLARFGMLCLGSDHAGDFDGEHARKVRALARALAAELHEWVTRHLSHGLQQEARLQQQDIDLLRLERQGLSTKAISLRTGLSRAAVDSRFQRLNLRLECANRKASARRAAEYGLL